MQSPPNTPEDSLYVRSPKRIKLSSASEVPITNFFVKNTNSPRKNFLSSTSAGTKNFLSPASPRKNFLSPKKSFIPSIIEKAETGKTITEETNTEEKKIDPQLEKEIKAKKLAALSIRLSKKLREESWRKVLGPEFEKPYWLGLVELLNKEKSEKKNILPPEDLIFNAFNNCPFENIKVVIVGQDPYPTVGHAMGLCFSVNNGVAPPASLKNIFKELKEDIPQFNIPKHGNLQKWARQGVLLLNAVLTVRSGEPDSHAGKGWENLTTQAIKSINSDLVGVVFLLWGAKAQAKENLINTQKHFILKTMHPSPLSARKGFFGCKHFSKTNELLTQQNKEPIDWTLDNDEFEGVNQRKRKREDEDPTPSS